VVQLVAHRTQTGFDVTKTLPISELSEAHRQILIPAGQASVMAVTVVARHTLLEFNVREVSDQLRENGSAGIHPPLFRLCSGEPATPFFPIFPFFWFKSFLAGSALIY